MDVISISDMFYTPLSWCIDVYTNLSGLLAQWYTTTSLTVTAHCQHRVDCDTEL